MPLQVDDLQQGMGMLQQLQHLRGDEADKYDQAYITIESIVERLAVIQLAGMLDGRRVLAIGDADMTGTAVAVFGQPTEVVVTDIDQQLSEFLFQVNMEFDIPVRFVYHDMRIKIIEILKQQYSLIIMEPPATVAGFEVFISRAIQCLQPGAEDAVFITMAAAGPVRQAFDDYIKTQGISIIRHGPVTSYVDEHPATEFLQLQLPNAARPTVSDHWLGPFYRREVLLEPKPYRCKSNQIHLVGPDQPITSYEVLAAGKCPCGNTGPFVFHSDVPMI